MIKILIVDDSPFIRRILSEILNEDEEIYVVGEAKNGKEALEKIPILKPDLITLDIQMPIMDGITTLENIIKMYNIPVIIISNFTKEGAALTLEALEKGALDFIPKPKNVFSLRGKVAILDVINKIKVAVKSNANIKYSIIKPNIQYPAAERDSTESFEYIISIGTSTGGPRHYNQFYLYYLEI